MVADELATLSETIAESIAVRGIYLLLDERLDLVCGPGTLQNLDSPMVTLKIAEFAAAHGWLVTRYHLGFVFVADKVIIRAISH